MSFYANLTQSLDVYSKNPKNNHLVIDPDGVHVEKGKDPHLDQTIRALTDRIAKELIHDDKLKSKDALMPIQRQLSHISEANRGWFGQVPNETKAALSVLKETLTHKSEIDMYHEHTDIPQTDIDLEKQLNLIKSLYEGGTDLKVLARHFPDDVMLNHIANNPEDLDPLKKTAQEIQDKGMLKLSPLTNNNSFPENIILLLVKYAVSDENKPATIDLKWVKSIDWKQLEPILAAGNVQLIDLPFNIRNVPAEHRIDERIKEPVRGQILQQFIHLKTKDRSKLSEAQKLDRQLNRALEECLANKHLHLTGNDDIGWHASDKINLTGLAVDISSTPLPPEVAQELKSKFSKYQIMHGDQALKWQFDRIYKALDEKIASTEDLTPEQLGTVLADLVEMDSPLEFSRQFIPAFRRSDATAKTIVSQLKDAFPDTAWLQRVESNPLWLSAIVEQGESRKETHLDFTNLKPEEIENFLKEVEQADALTVSLNNSQDDLIVLLKKGALTQVTGLDLSHCQTLDWGVMEPLLARLPNLRELKLPRKLTNVDPKTPVKRNFERGLKDDLAAQLLDYVKAQGKSGGGLQTFEPHDEL